MIKAEGRRSKTEERPKPEIRNLRRQEPTALCSTTTKYKDTKETSFLAFVRRCSLPRGVFGA